MIRFCYKIGIACLIITLHCHGNIYKCPWQFSDEFLQNNRLNESENSTHSMQAEPLINHHEVNPVHTWMHNTDSLELDFSEESSITQTYAPWLTAENTYKVINIATLAYVCYNIYHRYQETYTLPLNPHNDQMMGTLKTLINSICPQFIQTIGTHGSFLIDSVEITFKALVYKTIAQLIVLCGHGNIVDFVGYGLQKATHLVL